MKIAVFYPESRLTGWSAAWGIVNTLRRMGHKVAVGAIPVGVASPNEAQLEAIKAEMPAAAVLKECDAILLSGPEHIIPCLDAIYGLPEWKTWAVPKLGWYHEGFFREDYKIDFDTVSPWSDEHFFPAIQDAEFFDQESFAKGRAHWLPLGVDTKMFNVDLTVATGLRRPDKTWPVAFIGSMYDKRQHYLNALSRHRIPKIRIGSVFVQDLGGYQAEESTRRLAENYKQTGVFFNLPAMSQLLVSKVYEVMACGTFLLTPEIAPSQGADKNMRTFESGKHCVFYRPSNLGYVAQLLRDWSSPEKLAERELIASAGCREVHLNHSLEKRMTQMLAVCKIKEAVQ